MFLSIVLAVRIIALLAIPEPPDAHWLDDRRAVIAWQQNQTDLVCLSKDAGGRWVFLGCEPGYAGAHQVVLGEPGGDAAFLPEVGDRYWLDFYQDEQWRSRSPVGILGERPMRVWLPLISH